MTAKELFEEIEDLLEANKDVFENGDGNAFLFMNRTNDSASGALTRDMTDIISALVYAFLKDENIVRMARIALDAYMKIKNGGGVAAENPDIKVMAINIPATKKTRS